jgi:eukaryotic-like serine/threonine-protein kinase
VTTETCSHCGGGHPSASCPGVSRSFDSLASAAAGEGAALPAHTLPAGARVGEYQVTGLLGQGGMGVVYSGVHPLLGRKVAIKVLNRQLANPEAAARFLQEARAASRLRHQNIVDVFAFGQMPDGHYYQVMELLEGESLRAVLHRDGTLPPAQVRAVILGVLSALGAAHRRGIVHRDIKPDNIFLCAPLASLAAGDVKILDFGLAKHEAGDTSIKTRTGITMGTPAYMSPEQCRALPDIDARADIYAAGVVLFEMLSGHAPFHSESAFDVMTMQINVSAPRLSRVTGRTEPLEQVILQAMEKRPAARFDTTDEMWAAIDAALPADAVAGQTSSERRPARQPPTDLAERPTLVAASERGAAGTAGDPARSTEEVRRRGRRVPRVAVGVALAGAAAIVVVMATGGRADRPATTRVIGGDPLPAAAAPSPVSGTPAAPPRAPGPPVEAPRAPETAAAPESGSVRTPAAARGKPQKRPGGRAGSTGKRVVEPDLDSPLNPYAP